jgi:hypothetical protein
MFIPSEFLGDKIGFLGVKKRHEGGERNLLGLGLAGPNPIKKDPNLDESIFSMLLIFVLYCICFWLQYSLN